jgi:DNA-binding MarR family transcriptional regulator
VGLTEKGKALIDRALGEHVANESRLMDALSDKQRAQLTALLRRLLSALEPET